MPLISSFFGIDVYLYYADHGHPHFHVRYAGHEATVDLTSCEISAGFLPSRSGRLVSRWAKQHRHELLICWSRVRSGMKPGTLALGGCVDVVSIEVLDGFVVCLGFADGFERRIDLEPYLEGPVFKRIRSDPGYFRQVRADPRSGTIAWPNGADLAPDTLYEGRPSVRRE